MDSRDKDGIDIRVAQPNLISGIRARGRRGLPPFHNVGLAEAGLKKIGQGSF